MKRILLTLSILTLFGVSVFASTQRPTKTERQATKAVANAETARMVDSLIDSMRFWFVANAGFVDGEKIRRHTGMYTGTLSVENNKVNISLHPFSSSGNTIIRKKITRNKNKTEIELKIKHDYWGTIRTLYLTIFPGATASVSMSRGVSGFFSGVICPPRN